MERRATFRTVYPLESEKGGGAASFRLKLAPLEADGERGRMARSESPYRRRLWQGAPSKRGQRRQTVTRTRRGDHREH